VTLCATISHKVLHTTKVDRKRRSLVRLCIILSVITAPPSHCHGNRTATGLQQPRPTIRFSTTYISTYVHTFIHSYLYSYIHTHLPRNTKKCANTNSGSTQSVSPPTHPSPPPPPPPPSPIPLHRTLTEPSTASLNAQTPPTVYRQLPART